MSGNVIMRVCVIFFFATHGGEQKNRKKKKENYMQNKTDHADCEVFSTDRQGFACKHYI